MAELLEDLELEVIDDPDLEPPQAQGQGRASSLLDKLRAPLRSELSRKRKVERPKTANKKHKSGVANTTDPKSVTPATRVKQFPNECLAVRSGKLFCTACREELAHKKRQEPCLWRQASKGQEKVGIKDS